MGMPRIEFRVQMFRGDWDQVWSQMRLVWLMEGLCRVNQTHIRQFDEFKKRGLVERAYPSIYRAGLHYETEKGTEIWPDIPSLLSGVMGRGLYPGPWGDCLPLSTVVVAGAGVRGGQAQEKRRIADLKIGDRILEDGRDVMVLKVGATGKKPILQLMLDNYTSLPVSPSHRLLRENGEEVRAKDVKIGDALMTPKSDEVPFQVVPWNGVQKGANIVNVVEKPEEECADVMTSSGRFWLHDSNLVVHNCEDFACARVAEYRELPFHYERKIKRNGKERTEMADPEYPQDAATIAAKKAGRDWPGWTKKKGGVPAKPFAKWRRGPQGNYHYHALVLMPDLRLEDPSLVLGMGRERKFHEEKIADLMQDPSFPVKLQYAKPPKVMVVDPEKPSGYAGGAAVTLDQKIEKLVKSGMRPEDISATLGDAEIGAYLTNSIKLDDGEFDVDAVIGWNRLEGRFEPKTEKHELRRLSGYANHE